MVWVIAAVVYLATVFAFTSVIEQERKRRKRLELVARLLIEDHRNLQRFIDGEVGAFFAAGE